MYDLVIHGGTVVDGSGRTAFQADVAIQGGRVAEIGQLSGDAASRVSAEGLVVAPGFVDVHTHYDAQLNWDPYATPSIWHGVTTIVTGNCGVGIAPCRPEDREAVLWDLVNVEAMSFDVLQEGIHWGWGTFPEFLQSLSEPGLGTNLGAYVPLAALRRFAIGPEATERPATAEETAAMCRAYREALECGAVGLSISQLPNHAGYQGRPIASLLASRDELRALGGEMKAMGRGIVEIALSKRAGTLSEEELDMLVFLLESSERPVMWLLAPDEPARALETLEKVEPLYARGLRPVPQIAAHVRVSQFNVSQPPSFLTKTPAFKQVLNRTPDQQMATFRDMSWRALFKENLTAPGAQLNWAAMRVISSDDAALNGKCLADLARDRGADPPDVMLDIALADGLRTTFGRVRGEPDLTKIRPVVEHPKTVVGLSDAGAHVSQHCHADFATSFLQSWWREGEMLSLEQAVRALTSVPAQSVGFTDRGLLQPGLPADVVIFDPNTVGTRGERFVGDMPANGRRLVVDPVGVQTVIVNGVPQVVNGEVQSTRAGQLLRPSA
jgi:N-acyl-D-aspartate/D-glutamate deacylase